MSQNLRSNESSESCIEVRQAFQKIVRLNVLESTPSEIWVEDDRTSSGEIQVSCKDVRATANLIRVPNRLLP